MKVSFSQYVGAVSSPYVYTDNNPANWMDPFGLWSFSAELFVFYGGGFEFGQNDDGSIFFLVRGGVGVGGGISLDPVGQSPGYDPCKMNQDFNVFVGGFAEAGAEAGSAYAVLEAHTGLHSKDMVEAYGYFDVGPEVGVNGIPVPRLKVVAAGGVEAGFVWR